jgi:transcriptional regulator with XRE-family HTH domain
VLAELGETPERFFAEVYGFADLVPPAPALAGPTQDGAPARRQVDAEAEARRLADRLWTRISEAGLSQREVSRRLGVHRDYVNQVLRGNLELKVDHVLSILSILEVPPEEFFAEHYGVSRRLGRYFDPEDRLPGGVTWRELLAFFDAAAAELRTALKKGGSGTARPRQGADRRQPGRRRPEGRP